METETETEDMYGRLPVVKLSGPIGAVVSGHVSGVFMGTFTAPRLDEIRRPLPPLHPHGFLARSSVRLWQGRMTVCSIDLSNPGLESCFGSAEGFVKTLTSGNNQPGNTRHLVGQGHHSIVGSPPGLELLNPSAHTIISAMGRTKSGQATFGGRN